MRMSVAVVLALCLITVTGGLVLGAEPTAGQSDAVESDDDGSQTIEIRLEDDGDANVTVRKQFPLETREDREAFNRLAEDFETGEADGTLSADVFERIAVNAENETDRGMTIENVERGAESTASTGTLQLRLTWRGFAPTDEGHIEVGDAFVIEGETWLPSLSADQRLVIQAPEGYAVRSVTPDASLDDGTIVWEGPQQFESGQPTATLVQSRTEDGFSLLTVGLGLGLVGAIVALVFVLSRRSEAPLVPTPVGGDRGWATMLTPTPGRSEGEPADEPPARSDHDSEPGGEGDPFAGVDEDLLSDEERVIRLLEANDGRMKQANIVIETDWSNAKVSQLLSAMEADDEIEKLRIGRENLITLSRED